MEIRVLVVEDASFMREMVKNGLRSVFRNFVLDEASNGLKAREMLTKTRYDLVLCDWEMPEMTGAELLQWLRQTPDIAETPFIMITSRGDKEHVVKAIELKVSNYIVKPFTNDKLIHVVTHVLTKAKGVSAAELRDNESGKPKGPKSLGLSGSIPIAEVGETNKNKSDMVRPTSKVVIGLRFSEVTLACLLRAVSRDKVLGVIQRNAKLPALLDLVVLDIELHGEVSRQNGYVCALEARDDNRDTEFVNISVRLVDQDDPEKMAFIGRYMDSLT